MGGSGGGGYFSEPSKKPEQIVNKIRNEEENSKNSAFYTEVANLIRDILSDINARDTYTIQRHLDTIENAIHSEIEGTIDLRYAGSISKHTYVDGLSDVDSLAILNNCELENASPDQVKQYFYDMLKKRLPNTDIAIGNLAVTIKFTSGVEIQILPCLDNEFGIRIPSSRRNNEWSHIVKPDQFAKALRFTNMNMSGKVIPVIKLAKSIISSFAESRKISGYHVEALAVEIFSKYKGEKTPKAMLKYFFNEGSKFILNPVKDKSGQSIHVDDYLDEPNSLKRKMISDSMATVARRMQNADGSREIRFWEEILK